jgi:hypothetical protein
MRQGSDLSTEYASLYHTPPFSSPPVTHIDKDGYAQTDFPYLSLFHKDQYH